MQRGICWLVIFILGSSLLPVQAGATDEPVATQENVTVKDTGKEGQTQEGDTSAIVSEPKKEEITPSLASLPVPPEQPITSKEVPATPVERPTAQSQLQAALAPETTPAAIITTFDVSSTVEFIELYNQSEQPMDMAGMKFRALASDTEPCELSVAGNGWLLPGEYLTITSPTAVTKGTHVFSADCPFVSGITRLEMDYQGSRIQFVDGIITSGSSWLRHAANVKTNTATKLDCVHKAAPSSMKQTGNATDYVRCQGAVDLYEGNLYSPPVSNNLKIVEILPNARSCMPSDTSLDCSDYVKVKNVATDDVNLADFRIRTGAKYANVAVSNSFNWHQPTLSPVDDELILSAGGYFLLRLRNDGQVMSLPASEGNIWIEDYYGVQTYDEASYSGMGLAVADGKSWAYDANDQTWKFGVPSPSGDNTYAVLEPGKGSIGGDSSALKPCRDDQYRSEETNRCRSLTTAGTLAPCKEGQYRNEETNRCRSVAMAAAAVLKPCADDQFRNPESGRCKKIASSDDATLVDCGEGRERNPDTNRCRNVLSSTVPSAAFAVEPVKETGKAFVGWWALGGVGVMALGYGVWEWRREIRTGITKIGSFFTSGK